MRVFMTVAVASALALTLSACKPQAAPAPTVSQSVMDGFAKAQETSAADNLKTADDFLARNKTASGVQTTASGLQYAVLASGPEGGAKPGVESIVQVNYEGKLLDGKVFDSSFARGQAAEFPVGQLVPAWVEALQLMKPGDEWTIWVHPSAGYGEMGAPPDIPPNALLIFRMRLEKIVAGPGSDTGSDAGVKADKGATR
jgi:FKBP-type peptidyl-prolyl cis-trans isomerase FklB